MVDPWTDCKNSNSFIHHRRIFALSDCLALEFYMTRVNSVVKQNKIDLKFRWRFNENFFIFLYSYRWIVILVIFFSIILIREKWLNFQRQSLFLSKRGFLSYNLFILILSPLNSHRFTRMILVTWGCKLM